MDLDDAVRFHGHLCPMFYLGLRMGELALKNLGRQREDGAKLLARVEFRNCLADGIQYTCGATYGKNNLFYAERGKFATAFQDLASDKKLRIRVKNSVLEKTLAYGLKGQEVKSKPVASRQKDAAALFKWGREIVEEFERMGDEDLFEVVAGEALKPEPEAPLKFIICNKCGEAVLEVFSRGGRCGSCSGE